MRPSATMPSLGGLLKKVTHRLENSGKAFEFHFKVHTLAPWPVTGRRISLKWSRGDKVRCCAALPCAHRVLPTRAAAAAERSGAPR